MIVAPRVGAWIEIYSDYKMLHFVRSPLAWGRGLKFCTVPINNANHYVAPRVGAWIEMSKKTVQGIDIYCRPSRGGVD